MEKTAMREMRITRTFKAPLELTWEVWTTPEHVMQWWGPNGFTSTIHKMEFKEGGEWNLTMHGPDGTNYPNRSIFKEIVPFKKIVFEHFNPHFITTVLFEAEGNNTRIDWSMLFDTAEMRETIVKAHKADEGQKQNVEKLEAYLNARLQLQSHHQQLKSTNMSRVSTYLNFANNTEAAFIFYKSVFGTEFSGNGIQRFGDIPASTESMPQLSAEDKKLILHIELPILGGHVLMGTDAPESMGFKMNFGNNMHIHLQPETRQETKKLFDALSAGGQVTMPLQDMFWGAYYGSCTDKFGVQWMFNCGAKE